MYRAARDKRIEVDKQKREAIEQHKQRELQAQKAEVASWQESVASQGTCYGLNAPATHIMVACLVAHSNLVPQIKKVIMKTKIWLNLLNYPVMTVISIMAKVGNPRRQRDPASPSRCFALMMQRTQLPLSSKLFGGQPQTLRLRNKKQILSKAQTQSMLRRHQSQAGRTIESIITMD